jgi:DNA-binding CsgD family transcriptional regulator
MEGKSAPESPLHRLRKTILDAQRGSAAPAMLDCAAHMLLYFDQPDVMRQIALQHLLERFDATRADLGFASPLDPFYCASSVEQRTDCRVPDVLGTKVPNQSLGVQTIWRSRTSLYFDVANEPACHSLRPLLERAGTRAKMARRVEHADRGFALICVDHTEERRLWGDRDLAYFDIFVDRFLAPIIAETRLHRPRLTKAEREVVELAARGFSYKEIALTLRKSPNTVDNQLRTLREKFGVRNQIELVRACADDIV